MIKIIKVTDLGTNCWAPARFGKGRCNKVKSCNYPEKKTCMAVHNEIAYLRDRQDKIVENFTKRIEELEKDKTSNLSKLAKDIVELQGGK